MENTLGITVKKEDNLGEWYSQVIRKAKLADYSPVSGCIIFMPASYEIWEQIKSYVDFKIKEIGIKNAYFPMLIPEDLLQKEQNHVDGFVAEVAWVTHGGQSELPKRLAIRPTSESIIYNSYSSWIQSYRDLPLRLNQWCNVVRWEFKHPIPFIRTREFLWQEGHTAFATSDEAEAEVIEILNLFSDVFEKLLALPVIKGKKSEAERFAGAWYTLSIESFLPSGKAIQAGTSHCLGQNFAKAFDITFIDKDEKQKYVWQNSWGISTRAIGAMILMHSDNKGLVLPPKVACTKAVIVPILFEDTKEKVLRRCREIRDKLCSSGINVIVDERDEHTPGFKFNEWELKGIPIRVELGPKDFEKDQAVLVRRDTGKKEFVDTDKIVMRIPLLLDEIQQQLYDNAKKLLDESIIPVQSLDDIKEGKLSKAYWCGEPVCEERIKEMKGVKSINHPFDMQKDFESKKCFACENKAKGVVLFGKSY